MRAVLPGNFDGVLEAQETPGNHNFIVVPTLSCACLQEPFQGLMVRMQEINPYDPGRGIRIFIV